MRVQVVQRLIELMRASGYPGYEENGLNSNADVVKRIHEMYTSKYGTAAFMPAKIQELVVESRQGAESLVQDKVATPSDSAMAISEWQRTIQPSHIVNETSSKSQTAMHDHYSSVFFKIW